MLFIHKFLKNNKISFIFQNKGIVFKALVCGIVGQLYVLNIVQKWIFGYCIQKSIQKINFDFILIEIRKHMPQTGLFLLNPKIETAQSIAQEYWKIVGDDFR